jgi:hypothetical protein
MEREPIMQFFKFDHLPAEKQAVSKPFGELAEEIHKLPRNPERSVALRKLLEAKDAAVRASFMVLLALLCFVPMAAFAQDVPTGPTIEASPHLPPLPAGVPSIDQAPLQFATVLLQLAQAGRWGAFASLLVFALVFVVRKFSSKLPEGKVRDALTSKWGGWAMNFVSSLSAGFSALAFIGAPFTLVSVIGVLGGAVTYTLGAAGLVELQKDLTEKRDTAATTAGATAAAGITTKDEVVAALEKGPPAP